MYIPAQTGTQYGIYERMIIMRKKILSTLVVAAMTFSLFTALPAHAALQGSGTEKNPFVANDEETLRMISDFPDAYWILSNDIELTGEWDMIGYTSNAAIVPFTGVLDGNGYKITGLYQNTDYYVGFLGINEGTIRNLHIEGNITVTRDYQNALFVYTNRGTIENCSVSGNLYASTSSGWNHISGALTHENEAGGVIRNCYSRVTMEQRTYTGYVQHVGGLVGENAGYIENCYAAAPMESAHKGLIGKSVSGAQAVHCYYDKELSGCADSTGGSSGKSSAAMKMQYTYENWDFDNVWAIDSSINDGYPYLKNEKSVDVKATDMTLDKTQLTLEVGETASLTPIFTPDNVTNKNVTWSTTSRYVASVSDTGIVEGVSEGEATITATSEDGGFTAVCTVNVIPKKEPEQPKDYTVEITSNEIPQSGKFRAEVNVTKNTDIDDGIIIIAMYESSGELSDYIFIDGSFDTGKTYNVGGTLDAIKGGQLRAFVWDSFSSMNPLSNIDSL